MNLLYLIMATKGNELNIVYKRKCYLNVFTYHETESSPYYIKLLFVITEELEQNPT